MTILVIAGSAQFTALALLEDQAPTIIVIIASLAVNLRMAMYSAAMVPHLGKCPLGTRAIASYFMVDQTFAVAIKQFEQQPAWPLPNKVAYFFGCATSVTPFWISFTLLGALVGQSIPKEFSLDFAIPICFIAITAPMMRSPPHLSAAVVSILIALLLSWMPYNLWLLVAAVIAMMAGAQTELWIARRQA